VCVSTGNEFLIIIVFGNGYKNIEMQKDEVLVAHFGGRQEGRGGGRLRKR
jgi:hypothetical protein